MLLVTTFVRLTIKCLSHYVIIAIVNKKCGRRGFGRHGMPPPPSFNTGTALGQDGSDWSHDLATLTFDLGGPGTCGWCGSSSSIRVPSLKFVGLAVRKLWRTMCVSINGPGVLDLWPFDLETGLRVASKVGNLLSKFGHARFLGSRIIRYVRDGRTDRRTDTSNAYCPFPTGGRIISVYIVWTFSSQRNTEDCSRSCSSTVCRCSLIISRRRCKMFVNTLSLQPEMTTISRQRWVRCCSEKYGKCAFWRSTSSKTVTSEIFLNLLLFNFSFHICMITIPGVSVTTPWRRGLSPRYVTWVRFKR